MFATILAAGGANDLDFIKARVLLAVGLVVIASWAVGALFRRLNQPPVIGEILAGVLLGPSLLGEKASTFLFPLEIRPYLKVIAELGLVIFMFLVGLELDLRLIRGRERLAAAVSASSVLFPFVLGAAFAIAIHSVEGTVHGKVVPLWPFALFIGASLAVTAFPVLARILSDRDMFRTSLGAIALACAAVDDMLAWAILAVVLAVVESTVGTGGGSAAADLLRTVGLSAAFFAGLIFLIRPLLRRMVTNFNRTGKLRSATLVAVLVGILLSAWATQEIGIHSIFGAFAFGAILPREGGRELFGAITMRLEQVCVLLLLPVFFITTGLSVDIQDLGLNGLIMLVAVTGVACAGKLLGTYVPARLSGVRRRRAAVLGVLMNTRGLTELVILSIGRDIGVLNDELFTMLVVMAIVTTTMTGPALGWLYPERLLRRDQAQADDLSDPRGLRLMAAATSDTTLASLSALASALTAGERPATVDLSRIIRPDPVQNLVHRSVSEFADGFGLTRQLEAELAKSDVSANANTMITTAPTVEVARRAGQFNPTMLLLSEGGGDWVGELLQDRDLSVVLIRGNWRGLDRLTDGPVRLDLSDDNPFAVEVAGRLALGLDRPLEIADASRSGQRRRIGSFRDRLSGAGVVSQDSAGEPPCIVVADSMDAVPVAPRHVGVLVARGPVEDHGDGFQHWLTRRRQALKQGSAEAATGEIAIDGILETAQIEGDAGAE